ncbi:MAG: FMN reductase [Rhodobacteraceae bacterium]|nr:FMN reductase [Paracoccaceae bacterium]
MAETLTPPTEIPMPPHVSEDDFKSGMARLAGAVNIVTTAGPEGRAGFTASAVCSVTAEPPTLLVCLNRTSSAAAAFAEATSLCVNTVGPKHKDLAMLFGGKTPMEDRFAAAEWSAGVTGAPILSEAVVSFDCTIKDRAMVGSHDVIFCEIHGIAGDAEGPGLAYFARKFHELEA